MKSTEEIRDERRKLHAILMDFGERAWTDPGAVTPKIKEGLAALHVMRWLLMDVRPASVVLAAAADTPVTSDNIKSAAEIDGEFARLAEIIDALTPQLQKACHDAARRERMCRAAVSASASYLTLAWMFSNDKIETPSDRATAILVGSSSSKGRPSNGS